jgi:hypothetical protein
MIATGIIVIKNLHNSPIKDIFKGIFVLIALLVINFIIEICFVEVNLIVYIVLNIFGGVLLFFLVNYKEKKWKLNLYSLFSFAIIILEIFMFNPNAYYDSKYTSREIALSDVTLLKNAEYVDGNITIKSDTRLVMQIDGNIKNIYFEFVDKQDSDVYIDWFLTQSRGAVKSLVGQSFNPVVDKANLIDLGRNSSAKSLEIRIFPNYLKDIHFKISHIYINYALKLRIDPIRFLIFLIPTIFILNLILKKKIFKSSVFDLKKAPLFVFSGLTLLIIAFVLFNSKNELLFYLDRSIITTGTTNAYAELFDAFLKGQVHLDIAPDPRLVALENPYNPSSRAGIPVLWDRALFSGKYYSYFGIAPIILVYYPLYFLTGKIPQLGLVYIISFLYFIPLTIFTLFEGIKTFSKNNNLGLFAIVGIALTFGGAFTLFATPIHMYNLAVMFGNITLLLFLYFTFKSFQNSGKKRMTYLGLSGVSLTLILLSRPSMMLFVLITIPLYFEMLFKGKVKKNFIEFIPLFSTVIVGFSLVGIYNYSRFGNLFDFGNNYQMTVSDISLNKISLDKFPLAFKTYFLTPTLSDPTFPFYEFKSLVFNESYYIYNFRTLGIFRYPLIYLSFGILFIIPKKDNIKLFIFILSAFIIAIILGFISFCLAGIHYRYTLDILPVLLLVSGMSIVLLESSIKPGNKRFKSIIFISTVCLSVASITLMTNLLMKLEDQNFISKFGQIFQYFHYFFR